MFVQQARDSADAHSCTNILVIDGTDNIRLVVVNLIASGCVIALADITIAVRGATEHIDLSLARAMPLAAAGSLKDLRPLVFRDHALELHQQLILRCRCLWRLHEHRVNAMAREFFDQKPLIGIFSAQPVGCINQHRLDLTFRSEIAYPLEPQTNQ